MHTAHGLIACYKDADTVAAVAYQQARRLGCSAAECQHYGQLYFRRTLYSLLGY